MARGFNPMQQIKQIQERMSKVHKELATKTVESSSGGGMVSVTANGHQEIVRITIDPQVVDPEDVEMLQDLIQAAVNDALRKSRELIAEEMSKITGGMNIPGLNLPGLF